MSVETRSDSRWPRQVVGAGAVMALLSLASTPTTGGAAWLQGLGAPPDLIRPILHIVPLVATLLTVAATQPLRRVLPRSAKVAVYAGLGAVVGVITGFCLDIFGAFSPQLERLFGPLREADTIEIAAWAVAFLSLFMAGVMALIAAFGTPAMRAIADESADPESLDMLATDRHIHGISAVGMLGQALFVGALPFAHLIDTSALSTRIGIALVVVVGAGLFAWSSWRLWRLFDEMMRTIVMNAYAGTGLVASVGCLGWAVLESLALAPPMSAYAATVCLVILQTVVTVIASLPSTLTATVKA